MSTQVKGLEKLLKKLDRLEKQGATRAMRKATRAGTTVLGRAVKASTPVDEGNLKRAQATKVSGRGLSMSGRAGADVGKLEADERRPTNIDWLVEYGHVAPDGTFIPPSGYMRRAETSAMPAAEAAYIAKLTAEIEREALK